MADTNQLFHAPLLFNKMVGVTGLEPATSEFQARPSATDITLRLN